MQHYSQFENSLYNNDRIFEDLKRQHNLLTHGFPDDDGTSEIHDSDDTSVVGEVIAATEKEIYRQFPLCSVKIDFIDGGDVKASYFNVKYEMMFQGNKIAHECGVYTSIRNMVDAITDVFIIKDIANDIALKSLKSLEEALLDYIEKGKKDGRK